MSLPLVGAILSIASLYWLHWAVGEYDRPLDQFNRLMARAVDIGSTAQETMPQVVYVHGKMAGHPLSDQFLENVPTLTLERELRGSRRGFSKIAQTPTLQIGNVDVSGYLLRVLQKRQPQALPETEAWFRDPDQRHFEDSDGFWLESGGSGNLLRYRGILPGEISLVGFGQLGGSVEPPVTDGRSRYFIIHSDLGMDEFRDKVRDSLQFFFGVSIAYALALLWIGCTFLLVPFSGSFDMKMLQSLGRFRSFVITLAFAVFALAVIRSFYSKAAFLVTVGSYLGIFWAIYQMNRVDPQA